MARTMNLVLLVLNAITLYLPAMVTNATPVFVRKGTPIDLGKKFIDGHRILGDGKTFEGLLVGLYFGFIVSFTYMLLQYDFYSTLILYLSCIAAILGDLLGSFIKRRLGLKRGERALLLDQLDFFLASSIVLIIHGLVDYILFIVALVIIVLLHIFTNRVAYILGLKNVPW